VVLVPNGSSLAIQRTGEATVIVDGGDPAGLGEAVAFALSGRVRLRDGAHLQLER
jgi:hypothetical protein